MRQFLHMQYPGGAFLNVDEIQREDARFAHPVAAGRELLRRMKELEAAGSTFAVWTALSSTMNPCRAGGIIGSATMEDCDLSTMTNSEADDEELEILLEAARRATWDALRGPRFLKSCRFLPFPEDSQVGSGSAAGTFAAAQQGDAPDGASRRGRSPRRYVCGERASRVEVYK